jgi:hypothetical protein
MPVGYRMRSSPLTKDEMMEDELKRRQLFENGHAVSKADVEPATAL